MRGLNGLAPALAEETLLVNGALTQAVLSSLKTHIAVLDADGIIIAVNQAWERFARENGDPQLTHTCVGINYLDVCRTAAHSGSDDARHALDGTLAVMSGERADFALEYPCHSPDEKRWFVKRVTPLEDQGGVVISHEIITERKQAEAELHTQQTFVELLQVVAVAANQASSVEQALQIAIDKVCTCIGWPVGHAYLVHDGGQNTLASTDIWYMADPARFAIFRTITDAIDFASPDDLPGKVVLNGKPEWVVDLAVLSTAPRTRLISDIGVSAGFAFPVLVGTEVAAVLEFFATEPHEPDKALLEVMAHVGTQLGRVVERARAEASLRESEERFRVLFEHSPDAITLVDPHHPAGTWPIVECNDSTCRMNGYTRDELIGQSSDMLNSVIGTCEEREQYLEQLRHTGTLQIETLHRRKDGTIFPIEVVASLISVAGRELVLGVDRDISERKRGEMALRESERLYRTLASNFPNGAVVLFDHDLRFTIADGTSLGAFGLTREELEDRAIWDIYPPEQIAELEVSYRAALAGASQVRETTVDDHTYIVHTLPVRDEHGEIIAGMLMSQDITARKQAEAALIEERALMARRVDERTADLSAANAELARAARLKDEFLASMSHELRTPLNAVLGLSEALQEEIYGPLNDRQRRSLYSIEESGRHLLTLINDILDLAKIGADKLDLLMEAVSVAAVCEASLRMMKQLAQTKQISIESSIDQTAPIVRADARRLKQILVNLLSNAVKFTPQGGTVSLSVWGDAEAGRINFAVHDTGIGIPPEHLPRLFQPFVQLDSGLARQYGGTGLGLALVSRMVEMHGGSISVSSTLGVGSRFTVTLPWQPFGGPDQDRNGVATQQAVTLTSPVYRALIIEDSPTAAEQIGRYLTEFGVSVETLGEGRNAVACTLAFQPDLILLDILLPDTSGWDVLCQLKAEPRTRAIPVIIVSVMDEQARGLKGGAAAYIVKPCTRNDIYQSLDQITRRDQTEELPTPIEFPKATLPVILLAEDNEANIHMTVDYLSALGYQVVVTRNGIETIARAREVRPTLILMDIQMPEMDGIEATRRIRADNELKSIPIIALTALAMPGDPEKCLAAGANDYLSKPISLKRLALTIAAYLQPALHGDRIHP